jgi:hypothetical protein
MFIIMIILSVVAAIYAGRGLARAVSGFLHSNKRDERPSTTQ